jgi:DNA-binding CsgD family transcriptional regulator
MATSGQRVPLPEVEPDWTPRQREVLDLLVRGRTNGEIAEALGISLDGAKWHVSEIITKLGVDSREEAAEYWRYRNGLKLRFTRSLQAMVGGLSLRVAGAAVIGLALVAAVAAAVLIMLAGRDGSNPAVPTETVSPTTTGTTTPAATSTPTSTATVTATTTATAGTIGLYQGLPVFELGGRNQPAPLPKAAAATSVLYFTDTCAVCIGLEVFRLRSTGSGWLREPLLVNDEPGLPHGYPLGVVGGEDGRFAAVWCAIGERGCGKTHSEVPDTTPRILVVSTDGGVSWRVYDDSPMPLSASPLGFAGDQVILAVPDGNGGAGYYEYPSGKRLPAAPDQQTPAPAGVTVRLEYTQDLANEASTLIGVSHGTAAPDAYYSFPGGRLFIGVAISESVLLGLAERNPKAMLLDPPRELEGFARAAVLVDLTARTVRPVEGLESASGDGGVVSPFRFDVLPPALVVAGAGDCLNVRETPGRAAGVTGCFADGVLLLRREGVEPVEADGVRWLPVRTPGGRDGWASAEFLAE